MTYSVSLQWLCDHAAVTRVHESPQGAYGDPYVWCTTISRHSDTAIIHGAIGAIPRGGIRQFKDALRVAGFRWIVHDRIKDGRVRTVTIKL